MWQSKLDNLNSATDMIQNVIQKPHLLVALMEVLAIWIFTRLKAMIYRHVNVKEKNIDRDLKEREACLKVSFCQRV